MKVTRVYGSGVLLFMTLLLFATSGIAVPIQVQVKSAFGNGGFEVTHNGVTINSAGGRFEIYIPPQSGTSLSGEFTAYCVDPYHFLGRGTYTMDLMRFESYMTDPSLSDQGLSILAGFDSATNAERQKWAWEIALENSGSFDLLSGNLTVTGSGGTSMPWDTENPVNGYVLSGKGLQKIVFSVPAEVPEPTSLALLGLGLLGIGYTSRSRKKT